MMNYYIGLYFHKNKYDDLFSNNLVEKIKVEALKKILIFISFILIMIIIINIISIK